MIKRRFITIAIVCALVSVGLINTISTPTSDISTEFSKRYILSESTLNFSTYLGGQNEDVVRDMVIDSHGDIYITGYTYSADFPTTEGAYDRSKNGPEWTNDAFVMKLSADGQEIIYATYIGGTGDDDSTNIKVDAEGCVYIVGYTESSDYPTVNAYDSTFNGGDTDCFVTKLSADGTELLFSTFIGGSGHDDIPYTLSLDNLGNVVVVGSTSSSNFPVVTSNTHPTCTTLNGPMDGFVFKLSSDGSELVYSMYLGDVAYDVAIDSQNNAVIVGTTASTGFPTLNPLDDTLNGTTDCFITKVNATGHFIFSTFYGGSEIDYAFEITVSDDERLYVTGKTQGGLFPKTGVINHMMNETQGIFILVINPVGPEVDFSGVINGTSNSAFGNIVVLSEREVWLAGSTENADFPTTEGAFDTTYHGGEGDGCFLMMDLAHSTLNYSSFFGGSRFDYISSLAVDAQGNIICAGGTNSVNLPVMNALEPEKIGDITYEDGFVFRMQIDNATSTNSGEVSEVLLLTVTGVGVVLVVLMVVLIVKRRP